MTLSSLRLRNLVLAILLAVAAMAATLIYVSRSRAQSRTPQAAASVLVATRDIPVGTTAAQIAGGGWVRAESVPASAAVPERVAGLGILAGLVATQATYAGEQLTTRRFGRANQQGLRADLTGTFRVVEVSGDAHQLLAGTLRDGDRVDVLASLTSPEGGPVHYARVMLRNLLVVDAPSTPGGGGSLGGAQQSIAAQLELTDEQAQRLFSGRAERRLDVPAPARRARRRHVCGALVRDDDPGDRPWPLAAIASVSPRSDPRPSWSSWRTRSAPAVTSRLWTDAPRRRSGPGWTPSSWSSPANPTRRRWRPSARCAPRPSSCWPSRTRPASSPGRSRPGSRTSSSGPTTSPPSSSRSRRRSGERRSRRVRDPGGSSRSSRRRAGTGKSVVATSLASALARRGAARTFLVDLDVQFGDVAIMLGLEPENTLYDVVSAPGELDVEKLTAFTLRHESGALERPAAPQRPEEADLVSEDKVRPPLDVAMEVYDVVVVDTAAVLPRPEC